LYKVIPNIHETHFSMRNQEIYALLKTKYLNKVKLIQLHPMLKVDRRYKNILKISMIRIPTVPLTLKTEGKNCSPTSVRK
jgi:hypothetical protein